MSKKRPIRNGGFYLKNRAIKTIRQYIEQHIEPVTESGCWIWMGTTKDNGYGQFKWKYKALLAHRESYKTYRGQIPGALQVDHLCRVRCCVNPDHLELVSCKENVIRGTGPSATNASKTHCKRGHKFNKANTYYIKGTNDNRACRICSRIKTRERRTYAKQTSDS